VCEIISDPSGSTISRDLFKEEPIAEDDNGSTCPATNRNGWVTEKITGLTEDDTLEQLVRAFQRKVPPQGSHEPGEPSVR
jgi:hypothetical protein